MYPPLILIKTKETAKHKNPLFIQLSLSRSIPVTESVQSRDDAIFIGLGGKR